MAALLKLTLLGTLVLGFGACGSDTIDEVSAWADQACACKDKECATEQGKAYLKLGDKIKAKEKPSAGDMKKIMTLEKKGRECLDSQGIDLLDLL